ADTKLNIGEKSHLRNSADTKLNIEEKSHLRNSADTKLNIDRKAQRGGKTYTINTTNIGRKASTPLQASDVTVKDDHPLFAGQFGRITRLLNPDAAIVELANGSREKIQLKYLDVHQEENSYIQIAHHLKLLPGGLIEIHFPTNSKINGRLGRIEAIHESTVSVWVRDVNTMTMHKHTLKHHFVETVPLDREPQLVEVCSRIEKLRQYPLDPFEIEILLLLQRPIAFTPTELDYLAQIEQRHAPQFS
ncbi:MAG: hypothetical protein PUP93_23690, partial [Rhizonema sp. NSF051]|nr:hypothetical protein [Rhizonema sp. NSF051]